jgi:hypothetical protein
MMKIFAKVDASDVVSRIWEQDVGDRLPVTDGYRYEVLSEAFDIHTPPTSTSVPMLIDGSVAWVETATLSTMQADAIARCYVDVDAVYEAAIGRRQTEYIKAEAEARAYAAAGYGGDCGSYVTGFADHNPTGIAQSNQWSAMQIIGRADAFAAAELAMRNTRFVSQAAMRSATNPTELSAAISGWSAFIAVIRSQLGI